MFLLGRLTGDFTGFFKQGVQETEAEFVHAVDEVVYVTPRPAPDPSLGYYTQFLTMLTEIHRLQIAYVFLIKLCLTYLSNVRSFLCLGRISRDPSGYSEHFADSYES